MSLPTHLDRYGELASAGASGRLKPALHCTAQVTLRSTLQRNAGSGARKGKAHNDYPVISRKITVILFPVAILFVHL